VPGYNGGCVRTRTDHFAEPAGSWTGPCVVAAHWQADELTRPEGGNLMRIVADGWRRALKGASSELRERCGRVEVEINEKYAPRLRQAGIVHRFWLWLQMRIEIYRQTLREIGKIAPRGALYAAKTKGKRGRRSGTDEGG
jgi:hypothetical protein